MDMTQSDIEAALPKAALPTAPETDRQKTVSQLPAGRREAKKALLKDGAGRRACMLAYSFYETDNRVRRYAESLVRQGYQVDAITLRREGQARQGSLNGVRVFRIQERRRNERNKLSYLYRLLKFFFHSAVFLTKQHLQRHYALIHVHSVPDFEVFATAVAKMTGARIILDIHDIVPEFYASKFHVGRDSIVFKALVLVERASIAFSDHVIIANHIWQKTLLSRSVHREKCTTLLNYPDPSIFYRRPRSGHDGKCIIIYPGSINWHQGLDIAVRAVAELKGRRRCSVELHIYGDGPQHGAVEQLITDLGLQDSVFLKGTLPLEQIAAAMADADMGVVPKRNDPFGGDAFSTKILEFMALGIPVVAAGTRVDRYYFNDGIVRFFEPENPRDLAAALENLIRSRALRDRLASNASAFVAAYTWDSNERRYLSLVNMLTRRNKSTFPFQKKDPGRLSHC